MPVAPPTPGDGAPGVWIEWLDAIECWDRLDSVGVGRLGVIVDGMPEIHPVNFVVDDRSIVLRMNPGTMLQAIERAPQACFEVDQISDIDETGWSVLVKGMAVRLVAADELAHAAALPVYPWAIGDQSEWVRLGPSEITGRRIERRRRRSTA